MDEIRQLNDQLKYIAQVAREYANATPEQRAKVDPETVQKTIDQYNELKARRDALYIEQEARVQAELEAGRRAQEEAAAAAAQGQGRRRVNPNPTPIPTPVPSGEAFPVATNTDGTVRWSDGTNRNADGSIHDYGRDQSYVPGMSIDPRYATPTDPNYDARYDVNSPEYVYNKGGYNWKGEYVVNPEFADTYGKYDAGGRRVSDAVLAERQAYQDTLNMPWEKLTGLNNTDLLIAAGIGGEAIAANNLARLGTLRPYYVSRYTNSVDALPGGTNNYLTQGNNYLTQSNNYLTKQMPTAAEQATANTQAALENAARYNQLVNRGTPSSYYRPTRQLSNAQTEKFWNYVNKNPNAPMLDTIRNFTNPSIANTKAVKNLPTLTERQNTRLWNYIDKNPNASVYETLRNINKIAGR